MAVELSPLGAPGDSLVFMRFRPAWAYIDGIREFGRFFCQTTFQNAEIAERARVVIQETLENAVKYSVPGTEGDLELSISARGSRLEISVCSTPLREHLESLRAEIDRLNCADPEEAYRDAFARAADTPDGPARLGLARIRFEGNAELNMEEVQGGRIRITASGAL